MMHHKTVWPARIRDGARQRWKKHYPIARGSEAMVGAPYGSLNSSLSGRAYISLHALTRSPESPMPYLDAMAMLPPEDWQIVRHISPRVDAMVDPYPGRHAAANAVRKPDGAVFSVGDTVVPKGTCGAGRVLLVSRGRVFVEFDYFHLVKYSPEELLRVSDTCRYPCRVCQPGEIS